MKARPIPFSPLMVRVLLESRKTQTRRILGPQPDDGMDGIFSRFPHQKGSPYGEVGDLLWVREAWRTETDEVDHLLPAELAAGTSILYSSDADWDLNKTVGRRRHARFMPRWASRLTLELTGVRVERLENISEADAKAEGFSEGWMGNAIPETPIGGGLTISSPGTYASAAGHFQAYWCELHGFDAWDANPWVWVLEFKVHRCNVDELLKARAA